MPSKNFVKLDWFDDMVESEDDIYCVISIMANMYRTLKGAQEPELPSTLKEDIKPLTAYQKKKRRALNRYWVEQAWIKGI